MSGQGTNYCFDKKQHSECVFIKATLTPVINRFYGCFPVTIGLNLLNDFDKKK